MIVFNLQLASTEATNNLTRFHIRIMRPMQVGWKQENDITQTHDNDCSIFFVASGLE